MNDELKKALIEDHKRRFPGKKFVPGESAVPVSGKVFDHEEMVAMTSRNRSSEVPSMAGLSA